MRDVDLYFIVYHMNTNIKEGEKNVPRDLHAKQNWIIILIERCDDEILKKFYSVL